MPRGRGRGGGGHKGQRRYFTNPDHLEEVKEKQEREKQWRQQRGELSSEEEEPEEEAATVKSSSSEESESEESQANKSKGVQHLIEVENPNRVVKKEKKIVELETEAGPQLSRREREEIEKQKAKAHYLKMHAAGKTAEARADLARLAIIKQQREEAARRREMEIKAKEKADTEKLEQTKKALGKKT